MALPLSAPIVPGNALPVQAERDTQAQAPAQPELERHYQAFQRARSAGDTEAAQVIQGLIQETQRKLQTQEATSGMSGGEKFITGVGAGMDRTARGLADVATLGQLPHDQVADEDRRKASAQLGATDAGSVGQTVGENAALALPMGAAGSVMSKVGAKIGAAGLPTAAKLLTSVPARAAAEGAVAGAVSAEPDERGEGAAKGAAMAAGLTKGAQALRRVFVNGAVQPTAGARYLQRKGIDLTLGQMNPTGKLAQLEEASQSAGGFGRTIENQRAAGRESWQDAALQKGAPPGGAVPPRQPGNMGERLNEMYKGFEEPYQAAVKGEQVFPTSRTKGPAATPLQATSTGKPGAFDLAVMDPNTLATDAERQTVKKFLDNQLSILPGGSTRPSMLVRVPAETLQQIRSNIRKAVRDASSGGDMKMANLLVNAEREVGSALETQLKHPGLLKATDRSYAQYKTVEGAQASANGAPGDFTPAQLLRQVKQNMDKGLFARGGGGDLRRLATAGREALDTRVPATGARMLTHTLPAALGAAVAGAPGAAAGAAMGPTLTAGGLALANMGPVKAFLTGNTRPQRAAQFLERSLRRDLGPGGTRKALDAASILAALYGGKTAQNGEAR